MRITAELMSKSSQYLNAVGEFHIDLRGMPLLKDHVKYIIGLKIPYIENLASSKDQFGTIDLTDNEIAIIPVLPELKRLKTLMLSNNRISVIDPDFAQNCNGLENIVLINNKVSNLIRVIP